MRNYVFKEIWPSNLTKSPKFDAAKGGDVSQASLELKANPFTLHFLGREDAGIHCNLDAPGKSRETKIQVRLNGKNRHSECMNYFGFFLFNFRM